MQPLCVVNVFNDGIYLAIMELILQCALWTPPFLPRWLSQHILEPGGGVRVPAWIIHTTRHCNGEEWKRPSNHTGHNNRFPAPVQTWVSAYQEQQLGMFAYSNETHRVNAMPGMTPSGLAVAMASASGFSSSPVRDSLRPVCAPCGDATPPAMNGNAQTTQSLDRKRRRHSHIQTHRITSRWKPRRLAGACWVFQWQRVCPLHWPSTADDLCARRRHPNIYHTADSASESQRAFHFMPKSESSGTQYECMVETTLTSALARCYRKSGRTYGALQPVCEYTWGETRNA